MLSSGRVCRHSPGSLRAAASHTTAAYFPRATFACTSNVKLDFGLLVGQVKVVDPETCREMPVGETGEMWVCSNSVASGYWGKPELTKETFQARIRVNADRDASDG